MPPALPMMLTTSLSSFVKTSWWVTTLSKTSASATAASMPTAYSAVAMPRSMILLRAAR
ncbi:hypothetical protein HMPREF9570_01601 [Cutibacterium acnes HL043PA1]|nr:hypothetical protein HMPREF9570_01601 [Cutibacterium acnes HL043PA1]